MSVYKKNWEVGVGIEKVEKGESVKETGKEVGVTEENWKRIRSHSSQKSDREIFLT